MTAAGQRVADLEQQLAGLTARFTRPGHQAFLVKTLEEMIVERAGYSVTRRAALETSRPRHLHAVNGRAR